MYKVFLFLIFFSCYSFCQCESVGVSFEPFAITNNNYGLGGGFLLNTSFLYEHELNDVFSTRASVGIRFEFVSAHIGLFLNSNFNKSVYMISGFQYYFPLDNRKISNKGLDTRFKIGIGIGFKLRERLYMELTNYNLPNNNTDNFIHLFNLGILYKW